MSNLFEEIIPESFYSFTKPNPNSLIVTDTHNNGIHVQQIRPPNSVFVDNNHTESLSDEDANLYEPDEFSDTITSTLDSCHNIIVPITNPLKRMSIDNEPLIPINLGIPMIPMQEEKRNDHMPPVDEDGFWNAIALLNWCNASDKKNNIRDITSVLSSDQIKYIKDHIGYYASHIEDVASKYGWFVKATSDEIKNFTYHVIALGHQHYIGGLIDPSGFIQHIWSSKPKEYQNLYDMLKSLD